MLLCTEENQQSIWGSHHFQMKSGILGGSESKITHIFNDENDDFFFANKKRKNEKKREKMKKNDEKCEISEDLSGFWLHTKTP